MAKWWNGTRDYIGAKDYLSTEIKITVPLKTPFVAEIIL